MILHLISYNNSNFTPVPLLLQRSQIITFRGHFGTIDSAGGLGALALGPFTVIASDIDDRGASELIILSMGSITLKVSSHSK